MAGRPTLYDERTAARVVRAMLAVERAELKKATHRGNRRNVFNPAKAAQFFPALITGNAVLASASVAVGGGSVVTVEYRWKYAWDEAEFSGDTATVKSGGRSGTTTTDYAVNMAEMFHTGTYSWGVDITSSDYPTGSRPRPIGGGGTANTHRYNVVVWMEQRTDVNGDVRYYFHASGSHDGACA